MYFKSRFTETDERGYAHHHSCRLQHGQCFVRILLLHPDDSPDRGPWAGQAWDRVVDLGIGGPHACERWALQFGCPVMPIDSLRLKLGDFHFVHKLLAAGQDRLLDRENLDWWGLTAIFFHQQLETLAILRRFATSLEPADQVFVTRPGLHADALGSLLGSRRHCFSAGFFSPRRGPMHYARVFSKFPLAQLAEIFWDKYDASCAIRGLLCRRRKPSGKPVVLLPSAYVNVSRTGIAYAQTLPGTEFLLVTTRRSGWVSIPPANVTVASLASYAFGTEAGQSEYGELMKKWQTLRCELESVPEIGLAGRLGLLDSFPKLFRQGLAIRDAWRAVFDREPVKAVLCGDDSNPYTHIPLLLARNRGIPTLTCHHGALDGRQLIKRNYSDVILAKGKMEKDYLLRVCRLPPAEVEVGAPATPPTVRIASKTTGSGPPPFIVLFSEAYELSSGRAEEFYRDLLPPLAELAQNTHRKLIVKLHPFESRRERQRLVTKILSAEQQRVTTVVSGPLSEDLLQKTWFGITILSTVAVECAMRGIPCFLCGWLEYWPYGYIEQFSRFGVGHVLKSAAEISSIPEIVEHYSVNPELVRDLWQPIDPARLRELLSGDRKLERAVAI